MTQTQYLDFDGLQKYHQNIKKHFAPLDKNGIVPAANLPSYVDDVLEYNTLSEFPTIGEAGKIYVTLDTNLTYRWTGSKYIEISSSLALGTTSSTAFPGDRGATLETKVEKLENVSNSLPSDIIVEVESTHNEDNFTIEFTTSQKDQNGIYQDGTGSYTLIPTATDKTCGLMSKDDKTAIDNYGQIKGVLGNAADSFVDDGSIVRMDLWGILYNDSDIKLHTEYDTVSEDERVPSTLDLTINSATSEKAGVMSAADKKNLDTVSANITKSANILFFKGYVESATVVYASPSINPTIQIGGVYYVANEKTFALLYNGSYYSFDHKYLNDCGKLVINESDQLPKQIPFENTFYISTEDYTMFVPDGTEEHELHIINTKDITSQQINSL